jgi:DNA-directed RNA polymerase specialized sigma24 family protein
MRVMEADERAMAAIYDRHHRGLLSFCRHMLGSREEAEEAVRETFLLAQQALDRSEEPVELRPWLYAIARNRCIAMLRAGGVPRRDDALPDLARLPVDERAALLLAENGHLAPDEIARVLGVPDERAEALVVRARDSLIAPRRPLTDACSAVRVELARPGVGHMPRSHLRRHLRDCPRCRGYRESVRRQHTALAAPVAASAGLREAAVGSAAPRERRELPVVKLAVGAAVAVVAVLAIVAGVNALSQGATTPAAKPPVADAAPPKPKPKAVASAAAGGSDPRPSPQRRRHRRHHHRAKAAQTVSASPAPAPQPAPAPPPPVVTPKPKLHKVESHKQSGSRAPKQQQQPVQTPKAPKVNKAPKAPAQPVTPRNAAGGTAAPPAESDHHGNGRGVAE